LNYKPQIPTPVKNERICPREKIPTTELAQ